MSESDPRNILVVANRTAATPTLLEEVGKRAAAGPIEVTLLVPAFPTVFDPEALESRQSIELAVPLLEQVALAQARPAAPGRAARRSGDGRHGAARGPHRHGVDRAADALSAGSLYR